MARRTDTARWSRLPLIHRARGYRLYGAEGRRYIDFYQDGGRALLGHRPAGWTRIVKSTGNRGLFASYPSRFAGKARRAALSLFPWAEDAHIFPDFRTALSALSERGTGEPAADAESAAGGGQAPGGDPATWGAPAIGAVPMFRSADVLTSAYEELRDPMTVPLLRPFGPGWEAENGESSEAEKESADRVRSGAWGRWLLPLLPIPGGIGGAVILELAGGDYERGTEPGGNRMQGEGDISPLSEELMLRAMADLSRFMQETDAERWRLFDLPGFERRGPYLLFRPRAHEDALIEAVDPGEGSSLDASDVREYNNLFKTMLQRGVLLPPNPAVPAIIPGEYSDGEVQPLIQESRRRYADS